MNATFPGGYGLGKYLSLQITATIPLLDPLCPGLQSVRSWHRACDCQVPRRESREGSILVTVKTSTIRGDRLTTFTRESYSLLSGSMSAATVDLCMQHMDCNVTPGYFEGRDRLYEVTTVLWSHGDQGTEVGDQGQFTHQLRPVCVGTSNDSTPPQFSLFKLPIYPETFKLMPQDLFLTLCLGRTGRRGCISGGRVPSPTFPAPLGGNEPSSLFAASCDEHDPTLLSPTNVAFSSADVSSSPSPSSHPPSPLSH